MSYQHNKFKIRGITIFILVLSIFFSLVSAQLGYSDPTKPKLEAPTSNIVLNINETNLNVNNSDTVDGYHASAFCFADGRNISGVDCQTKLRSGQYNYNSSGISYGNSTIGISWLLRRIGSIVTLGNQDDTTEIDGSSIEFWINNVQKGYIDDTGLNINALQTGNYIYNSTGINYNDGVNYARLIRYLPALSRFDFGVSGTDNYFLGSYFEIGSRFLIDDLGESVSTTSDFSARTLYQNGQTVCLTNGTGCPVNTTLLSIIGQTCPSGQVVNGSYNNGTIKCQTVSGSSGFTNGSNIWVATESIGSNISRGLFDIYNSTNIGNPSNANLTFIYGSGSYFDDGYCYQYSVYAYKTVGASRVYSQAPSATAIKCDAGTSSQQYLINISWNGVNGASGYKVVVLQDDYYGAYGDYYFETTNNFAISDAGDIYNYESPMTTSPTNLGANLYVNTTTGELLSQGKITTTDLLTGANLNLTQRTTAHIICPNNTGGSFTDSCNVDVPAGQAFAFKLPTSTTEYGSYVAFRLDAPTTGEYKRIFQFTNYPNSFEQFVMGIDKENNPLFGIANGLTFRFPYANGASLTDILSVNANTQRVIIGNNRSIFSVAKFNIGATTEQMRLYYNGTSYVSHTVGSTGGITYDAAGPGANFTFLDNIKAVNYLNNSGTAGLSVTQYINATCSLIFSQGLLTSRSGGC